MNLLGIVSIQAAPLRLNNILWHKKIILGSFMCVTGNMNDPLHFFNVKVDNLIELLLTVQSLLISSIADRKFFLNLFLSPA